MSTYKDKLYFNYNGKSSKDFGIISVVMDNGMFEETLVADRKIEETKLPKRLKPFFRRIDEESLEFDLTIAFEDGFNNEKIRDVIDWLFVDFYKTLYFEEENTKLYRCMPVSSSSIVHNGLEQGYVTLTMRCDSPRVYAPIKKIELPKSGSPVITTITNDGSDIVKLYIKMDNVNAGLSTLSNNGYRIDIRGLQTGESLIVDTEYELIESNLDGVYHYNDIIGDLRKLSLQKGTNKYEFSGTADYTIYYQLQYKW